MWKSDRSKVNSSQHLWKLSRKVHGAYFWLLKVPLLFWSYLVIGNYCLEFFFPFRCFSPYWDVCLLPRASKTFWMNPKSLKHCLTAFISLPQSQPSYNEVDFNLCKTRRRGRNIIGQRAIVNVPGQRGGNITLCAAINHHGILHHHSILGPYNTARLLTFLDTLHNTVIPPDQPDNAEQPRYVVIWDNVSFHRATLVRTWFTNHPRFLALPLPPYSPFLNAIEEFFSAWRWKVYARNPQAQIPLIQAMEEACGDIAPEAFQGWIRHTRRYFPHCLARENIACDVDEVLWPDRNQRQDEA